MRLSSLFVVLLVAASALAASALAAPKPAYQPDPKLWTLEVLTPLGGWTSAKRIDLELKVADPKDPEPPQEEAGVDPDLVPDEDGPSETYEDYEARRARNAWRERPLLYWFNGVKATTSIAVGHRATLSLDVQDGENRLELFQPDSGRRAVRSFFSNQSRNRLVIRVQEEPGGWGPFWWNGGLQVVEPDHTESIGGEPTPSGGHNHGRSFVHPAPLPGTFTVRWFDSSAGVDGYEYDSGYESTDTRPQKVVVEVLLDAGTDRERRWRFERTILPGTKRVTLGSFDVED